MKYTLEEIYLMVGREDKVAGITFYEGSEAYKRYGSHTTVLFNYSEKERKELDQKTKIKPFKSQGKLAVKHLTGKQTEEQIKILNAEGFHSEDIAVVMYYNGNGGNTYHSTDKRYVKKLNIPMTIDSNGYDFNWMYGFKKKLVEDDVGLSPYSRKFYLALKYYFEPDSITEDEVREIYVEGLEMDEEIEFELLNIKFIKHELNLEETKRCILLFQRKKEISKKLLNKYLIEAGSSFKKLNDINRNQALQLLERVMHFKDIELNANSRFAIYLDIDSFLHIYMRHVEELQINNHFELKDNFQWNEEDVLFVMKEVVLKVDDEIQEFFIKNPGKAYHRYGDKSVYFQGDYYTMHIEGTGRVNSLYKKRKK